MIIHRIHIKSFGSIDDVTMDFSDSINVIEGQNESGKSTIAAFIKYMLYGFAGEDGKDELSEREKRVSWKTGRAEGSMTVTAKGKQYLISRSTVRCENFPRVAYKEECSITDLETGAPVFGKAPAGELFFNVWSDLFDNTAFIGQIGESGIDKDSVKKSIENILFSASITQNTDDASKKVSQKMHTLYDQSTKSGVICDLMQRSEDFEDRFVRADEENKKILAKEAKLHEIREARQEEISRRDKGIELDMCYRNVLAIQECDKLHALEAEYDAKNDEHAAFISENTKAGFVPTEHYLTDMRDARRRVDDAYRTLVEANQHYTDEKNAIGITREIENAIAIADEAGGESEVVASAKKIRHSQIKNIAGAVGGALVGVAALVFEIAAKGALAAVFARIGFGLLGAAGLILGAMMVVFFLKNKERLAALEKKFSTVSLPDLLAKIEVIAQARKKRDDLARSTENARIAVGLAKEEYDKAKDNLLEVILRWGEEPPASGLNDFLDGLMDKVADFLDKERDIRREREDIEFRVRELRSSLAGKNEIDIRALVPPLKRKVLDQVEHEKILEQIADASLKITAHDALAGEVEKELFLLKTGATDPGELYSKIQENEERIDELRFQHKSYYVALEALNSASAKLRLEVSPRLGQYSTKLMEIMTNKKYTGIDVTDGMKVSFTDTTGEEKSVDFLSGGTRDLTYIALRMALIDMLYSEKPPVCFDESFAHQDNVRAKSMMRAISYLAEEEGMQSFIFTCRAREAQLACEVSHNAAVFKLPGNEEAVG
jgi:uncharacterized protein YhaN